MKYFRPVGDQWVLVESSQRENLKEKLGSIDGKFEITNSTQITQLILPFYDNYKLLQLKDDKWEPKTLVLYYLIFKDDLVRLDGTSPPIHKINDDSPIKLTDENILFYLTYFCFFVRGDDGPFLIIDQLDNPYLPDKNASKESIPDLIKEIFRMPRAFGKNEQGHWQWSALVYYSNAVFGADFTTSPSGLIDMNDDNPIIADLPAKIDAPIA